MTSSHPHLNRCCSASRSAAGWTLPELLIIVVLIGITGTLVLTALPFLLQRDRAAATANELAGWLASVRRSGERGAGCTVTITTGASQAPGAAFATAVRDGSQGSDLANPCGLPLDIPQTGPGATFQIAANPTATFTFTPRGTVFTGGNTTPIEISINAVQAGAPQVPMRCVRIVPPLGLIEVVQRGATSGRCNP